MARGMVFNRVGNEELPDNVVGIWHADSEGHPENGIDYDTFEGFVIEAKSFDDVVKRIECSAKSSAHDDYVWEIKLFGIALDNTTDSRVVMSSWKAG